jgi:hypothetical protein
MDIATHNSADLACRPYGTDQAQATILAALRYYQRAGQGEPNNRSDDIHQIATDDGETVSLDAVAIDRLCEDLNAGALELVRREAPAPNERVSQDEAAERTAYTVIGRYLDAGNVFVTHVQAEDPTEAACDALHRMSGWYQPDDPEHRLDDVTAWELAADAKIVSIIEGYHMDQAVHI